MPVLYTDAELVEKVLGGDTDSYCVLVTRYQNLMYSVAYRVLGDYHTAQDVVQESFIEGFLKLGALAEREKFEPWMCKITRNKAIDSASRRRFTLPLECLENISGGTAPERVLLKREERGELLLAVSALSSPLAETVKLCYLEGTTLAEAAEALGVPLGTVKRRLHDARLQLKKELYYMNGKTEKGNKPFFPLKKEKSPSLPEEFAAGIKKKIEDLNQYYKLYGNLDGLESSYREVTELIHKLPEGEEKKKLFVDAAYFAHNQDLNSEIYFNDTIDAAAKAGDTVKVSDLFWEKYLAMSTYGTHEQIINWIDTAVLPTFEKMGKEAHNDYGNMLFWRGSQEFQNSDYEKAKATWIKVTEICDESYIMHANAISGIHAVDFVLENVDTTKGLSAHVCAERFSVKDGEVIYSGEPGFSFGQSIQGTGCDACLYYLSRNESETLIPRDLSDKEFATVTVPAGRFKNCLYLCTEYEGEKHEGWFAPGVGLVKYAKSDEEPLELIRYDIIGGEGYFPLAAGNRCFYEKKAEGCIAQLHEHEVTFFDGKNANTVALDISAYKKSFDEDEADSNYWIIHCNLCCSDWKTEEAIADLKRAVRKNSSSDSVQMALAGIEYLERFKSYTDKNWRIMPGSVGGGIITAGGGKVGRNGTQWSFGPYRYGTFHMEDRIFGMKPYDNLEIHFGCLWDDEWRQDFRRETEKNTDGKEKLIITSEDGGTVTTEAGTFINCRKLTVSAELMDTQRPDTYYFESFRNYYCYGTKEFWFAPGVGIVKHVCKWGSTFSTVCELTEYTTSADPKSGEYFPVYIGDRRVYDEKTIAEGYIARFTSNIRSGMGNRFFNTTEQIFLYKGTEEEYQEFKKTL